MASGLCACGATLEDDSSYCDQCGKITAPPSNDLRRRFPPFGRGVGLGGLFAVGSLLVEVAAIRYQNVSALKPLFAVLRAPSTHVAAPITGFLSNNLVGLYILFPYVFTPAIYFGIGFAAGTLVSTTRKSVVLILTTIGIALAISYLWSFMALTR